MGTIFTVMILEHRTIDLYDKGIFEFMRLRPPFRKPNPMPDEACFLHIIQGGYISTSEKTSTVVPARESVLMKCGSYLSEMVSAERGNSYKAVAVHFYPEILKKIYGSELPEFLLKQQQRLANNMVRLEKSELISRYIESVLFYFEKPHLVTEDILILKLKEIILLLLQTKDAPQVLSILTNLFTDRAYAFKEVIDNHLFTALTTQQLADLCCLSLSSFKRTFQRVYRDTPANYIRGKRLEKAAQLLCISERAIADIAYTCCFKSLAHFSSAFREKYDKSPSAYRAEENMNLQQK